MEPRTEIRYAIRDWLLGQTDVDQDVYATRLLPVNPGNRDVIAIYTFSEEIQDGYQHTGMVRRQMTLMVEIVAGGDEADDVIDTLAGQVERRINMDPQLGLRIESVVLDSLEVGRPAEDDRLLVAQQTWRVVYYTAPADTQGDTPDQVLVRGCDPYGDADDYKKVLGFE